MMIQARVVRNAADIIKARQKGIGTVYIGDIKALLGASGVSPGPVDEVIAAEARAGHATLARASSVKMTDAQKKGGLKLNGVTYETVTFK